MAQLPVMVDEVGDVYPEPEFPHGLLAAERMSPLQFQIQRQPKTSHLLLDSGSLDFVAGGVIACAGVVAVAPATAMELQDGCLESDIVRRDYRMVLF